MGWVGAEMIEEFVDEAEVALLGGFICNEEEVEGARAVVWVSVESGFAKVCSLAMLVYGDDAAAFMMQATGMDEAGVAGVVQTGKVAFLEVGEGCGELVGVLLLVGLGGTDEFRRRPEVPFREGHDTFQFGIQSSLG
jgi:hypothetical protein